MLEARKIFSESREMSKLVKASMPTTILSSMRSTRLYRLAISTASVETPVISQ